MNAIDLRNRYNDFVQRQQLGPEWAIDDQWLLETTVDILDEIIQGLHGDPDPREPHSPPLTGPDVF